MALKTGTAERKRLTRKALKKPDEFLTLSRKALLFIQSHARFFWASVGAMLVIGLLYFLFDLYRQSQLEKASQTFGAALRQYNAKDYTNALAGFYETASIPMSGSYRDLAVIYQANSQTKLQEFDQATKLVQPLLRSKRPLFRQIALKINGDAHSNLGNAQEAIQPYQRASVIPGPLQRDATLAAARELDKAGRDKEAVALYEEFLKKFPDSEYKSFVEAKLAALGK